MRKFLITNILSINTIKQLVPVVGFRQFGLIVVCVAGSTAISGCGQKNSLYLPEEANRNTKFILYKNDVSDTNATHVDTTQTDAKDTQSEVILPASEHLDDPNNY